MTWRSFWRFMLATALALGAGLYVLVVAIDPYDSLATSLPLTREPMVQNQRFSYPALARDARFDSAVIGTSTTRLLRPARLDTALGGRFVNLSMNSATAYEQSQILALFVRRHPAPRTVIIGIDAIWCAVGDDPPRLTERPFPPWLYDDNPWNDYLHLFNFPTLEQAGRMVAYLFGLRPARYGRDGYGDFLPPVSDYDLARARTHLYGGPTPKTKAPVTPPFRPTVAARAAWRYPTHARLGAMLASLPAKTRKLLMVVPYHLYSQPAPGSLAAAQWAECKRRVAALVAATPNAVALDFMIPSSITRRDENYWDPLHYTTAIADRLVAYLGQGLAERRGAADVFAFLAEGVVGGDSKP